MGGATKHIRELSGELCACQAQLLGSLMPQEELIRQHYKKEESKKEVEINARKKATIARHGRTAALSKQRITQVVETLIGHDEHDNANVAEYVQLGALSQKDYEDSDYTVPMIVPFLGHKNLVYQSSNSKTDGATVAAVRFLEMRAFENTAPLQLELISYDSTLENIEAPLATINNAEETGFLTYIRSANQLDSVLDELIKEASDVLNKHLADGKDIVSFNRELGSAIKPYQIVVLHNYPVNISESQHNKIATLARVAPSAGISLVFRLAQEEVWPKWFESSDIPQAEFIKVNAPANAIWISHEQWKFAPYTCSLNDALSAANRLQDKIHQASIATVSMDQILPQAYWQNSSEDGITFDIGTKGKGLASITLGSRALQRHNAIITGAVGQGKSNLLKVIIYDLCARYSPEELELYLLDFKEGVTLYPMAPTSDSPEYLPQAKALGLEADQDYGIEILRYLINEMARRSAIIKPYGDNILLYRNNSGKTLPRILLVVDEFQLLLGGSRGGEAKKLLERIVRQGRSSGIHVILASQSIGGISSLIGTQEQFFAQFPVRIGLKNSPAESRATFGQLNDAAAHLKFRGQAILNEDYGDKSANETVLVACADDKRLAELRDALFEKAKETRIPPKVFDGSKLPGYSLKLLAANEPTRSQKPYALLGQSIDVSQTQIQFVFDDVPGRNLAIIGKGISQESSNDPTAVDIASSTLLAIISGYLATSKNHETITLLDFSDDSIYTDQIEYLCSTSSRELQHVNKQGFNSWLNKILESIDAGSAQPGCVLIPQMEFAGTFEYGMQNKLQKLFSEAPAYGLHFIVLWANPSAISSQLGIGGLSGFDTKILLFGAESIAKQVLGPFASWEGQERRMLYCNSTMGSESLKLLPYELPEIDRLVSLQGGGHE